MHAQFADWYRIACVDLKDVDLKARWTGVAAAAKTFESDDVLDAARLFFGLTVKAPDFVERFRVHLKAADDKFPTLHNDVEMRVLAGATLVDLFKYGEDWVSAAGLALVCPSFRGKRPSPVGDIERAAREALAGTTATLREESDDDPPDDKEFAEQSKKHVASIVAATNANGDVSTLQAPLSAAMSFITDSIAALHDTRETAKREKALRREESDVLWWLFGESSRDLNCPFATLKPSAVPIVTGKELADLTRLSPGPYAARAFLEKAIRIGTKGSPASVDLAHAIGACSVEWLRSMSAGSKFQRVEDLCPTVLAIRKAAEANGKKAWIKVFEEVSGIPTDEKLHPVDLAEQMLNECLLARAAETVSEA